MREPKIPSGSGEEAYWFRWAHEEILKLRQITVQTQPMGRTTRGTYILPPAPKKKTSG